MLSVKILALLIALFVLSFYLNKNIIRLNFNLYRFVVIPGIALHELSHIAGCLLTGSKVFEAKIISSSGGYVKHSKSRLGYIGDWIISFAPIIAGLTISLFLFYLSKDFLHLTKSNILTLSALLYLEISIFLTMCPSLQDLTNSIVGSAIIFFTFIVADYYSLFPSYFQEFYDFLLIIVVAELSIFVLFVTINKILKKS